MWDGGDIDEYLEDLRAAGFDLSAPLPVEHYLHFEVAATAHGAAEELRREGFAVDVEPEDERAGWVAYATRPALPTVPELLRVRDRVAGTAASHGGAYEGWNVVLGEDEPDLEDVDVDALW
ncbi:MAG: ribonuclease E inhibitor RraB [Pseudomonadota bacterium]